MGYPILSKKHQKVLPSSLIVTQSNSLVEARYNLPLGEQRLILTMISKIQPEDEDFKPYLISVKEFTQFIGVDTDSAYRECKKITEKLLSRVINVEEEDGLLQIGWLSSAKYIDGEGIVNLSFDPLLKPYLLQLKSNFTSCKLTMLLSFKSQYSMRMYTFLKQYQKLGTREIEIASLRETLGVRTEQYKLYTDFKRNVLIRTQNELAEKADLSFEFEEIKYGRRVASLIFTITCNTEKILPISPTLVQKSNDDIQTLLALVLQEHQSKKTVISGLQQYLKKEGFAYVKRNILYSNHKAAKSYAGFLNKALKEDWGHDWDLDQQHIIKNKPKEIWERHGFASETEYDQFMYAQQMASLGKT